MQLQDLTDKVFALVILLIMRSKTHYLEIDYYEIKFMKHSAEYFMHVLLHVV